LAIADVKEIIKAFKNLKNGNGNNNNNGWNNEVM